MEYVRNDLGYVTDRAYVPLDLVVNAGWSRASMVGGPEDVGIALAPNPDLKVLVVHGVHDLQAIYFLSRYVLEQTTRARGARERRHFGTDPGGPLFHLRSASRAEFAADVRAFFEDTSRGAGPRLRKLDSDAPCVPLAKLRRGGANRHALGGGWDWPACRVPSGTVSRAAGAGAGGP